MPAKRRKRRGSVNSLSIKCNSGKSGEKGKGTTKNQTNPCYWGESPSSLRLVVVYEEKEERKGEGAHVFTCVYRNGYERRRGA